MTQSPGALELAFPSDVQYIEGVVAQVAAWCADLDFPARLVAFNVPLIVTEAVANAIQCGNRNRADATVHLRAHAVDRDEVVVEVCDDGPGFDLATAMRDPTTPAGIEREDGRGLFIMRHLAYRVEQFHDVRNVVRIRVRRSDA